MAAPSGRVSHRVRQGVQSDPRVRAKHAARPRARRLAIKRYGEAALRGKDVDHIKSLEAGGSNDPPLPAA